MNRRDFFRLMQAFGSLTLVSSGARSVPKFQINDNEHIFGVNIPFSSHFNEESNRLLLGHFLAVKHINEGSQLVGSEYFPFLDGKGLLDKKTRLVFRDTLADPETARKNATELFENYSAVMITGGSSSAEVLANRASALTFGRICMDGISHSTTCSNQSGGFSMNFDNIHSARMIASQMQVPFEFQQIYDGYDWSINQRKAFTSSLAAVGGESLADIYYEKFDFRTSLSHFSGKRNRSIVVNLYGQKLRDFTEKLSADSEILDELVEQNVQLIVPLLSDQMEKQIQLSKIPSLIATKFWDADLARHDSASRIFADEFKKTFGVRPYDTSYIAYFQMLSFANAAAATGGFDRNEIAAHLTNSTHKRFRYRKSDHRCYHSGVVLHKAPDSTVLRKQLV